MVNKSTCHYCRVELLFLNPNYSCDTGGLVDRIEVLKPPKTPRNTVAVQQDIKHAALMIKREIKTMLFEGRCNSAKKRVSLVKNTVTHIKPKGTNTSYIN